MVLAKEQIAVIKNDFLEKGWNVNKIWKKHPTFNCSGIAVYNLVKKFILYSNSKVRRSEGRINGFFSSALFRFYSSEHVMSIMQMYILLNSSGDISLRVIRH